jgi:VCBS repeat-containing protein
VTHWSIRHLLLRKLGGVFFALILGGFAIRDARAQVGLPPVIIVQPLDQTVLKDGTATFTVVASSQTTMSYKWYFESNLISGASAASYSVVSAQRTNQGRYWVEIVNAAGTTISRAASLTVLDLNDVPVSHDDAFSIAEDSLLSIPGSGILSNDVDLLPGNLTAALVTPPTQGALTLNSTGAFTYEPATNFFGTDSFQYRAFDGTDAGNIATVKITVVPVNDPPVAVNDSVTTAEDTGITIAVLGNDHDVDGTPLTITRTYTTNGSVLINGSEVVFIPATNFYGTTLFSYTISDGTASATGRVTVFVSSVNDPPIANADTTNTLEDVGVTIRVLRNDTDPEGAILSLVSTSTTNGTAVIPANGTSTNIVFTPAANFSGTASFSYVVSDGNLTSTGFVTVNVAAVNDRPVAVNDNTNTVENVSVSVCVLANDSDVEGSPLTLAVLPLTNGTAMVSGTNIVFRAATNFYGTTTFRYTISDGSLLATGIVTIVVAPDGPLAGHDTYVTVEDEPLSISAPGILGNDSDPEGDAFTAVLVNSVAHGKLVLNVDGSFVYTPNTDYNGTDSFTYRATDGVTTGDVATVVINITPVDDPLRFVSRTMTTNGLRLELSGPADSTYIVMASTNFADWKPISTNYTEMGNVVWTDPMALLSSVCMYRARLGPGILEQHTTASDDVEVRLGRKGAQSFRHGTNGGPGYSITKVVLQISRESTAPNTNLTFSIGTGVNVGAIGGSSATISPVSITNATSGDSFQIYEINFPTPVGPLNAGTTYYLNLECEAPNGRRFYFAYSGSNTYPNGTYYRGGSNDGKDMWFKIWGE